MLKFNLSSLNWLFVHSDKSEFTVLKVLWLFKDVRVNQMINELFSNELCSFLELCSFWNLSRLFTVQLSMCLLFSATFIRYHIFKSLSTTFHFFFLWIFRILRFFYSFFSLFIFFISFFRRINKVLNKYTKLKFSCQHFFSYFFVFYFLCFFMLFTSPFLG